MRRDPNSLDRLTRRLIQAAEKDLREFLRVPKLEQEFVAILYLRLRQLVESCDDDGAADELALSIYLTASAWLASAEPPVDLLTSLHQTIGATLDSELKPLPN
jgi:hypothetical protein